MAASSPCDNQNPYDHVNFAKYNDFFLGLEPSIWRNAAFRHRLISWDEKQLLSMVLLEMHNERMLMILRSGGSVESFRSLLACLRDMNTAYEATCASMEVDLLGGGQECSASTQGSHVAHAFPELTSRYRIIHPELARARDLVKREKSEAGIDLSQGIGASSKIPLQKTFVQLQLLRKNELGTLFDESSFSSAAELDRTLRLANQSPASPDVPLLLEELFSAGADCEEEPRNVLVLGGAGSGKSTTFLQMLVCLCSVELLWKEKFDLVFGVELRQPSVRQAKCLRELLAAQFAGLGMSDQELEGLAAYFRTESNRLCVVLDGLDECDLESCSTYIQNLLLRSNLPLAHLIVTTRLCDSACHLSQCGRYERQVEVMGFSPASVREYVRTCAGDRADEMIEKIGGSPHLAGMMSTPVFAALACEMFLAGKEVSSCPTALYQAMVLRLFERRHGKVFRSLDDIPADDKEALLDLSRLAFCTLVKKLLVFEEGELSDFNLSFEGFHIGLLMSFKDDGTLQSRQYRFLHLSLQEFLAAWFANHLLRGRSDIAKLVACLGECRGHLTMFWRFLVVVSHRRMAYALMEELSLESMNWSLRTMPRSHAARFADLVARRAVRSISTVPTPIPLRGRMFRSLGKAYYTIRKAGFRSTRLFLEMLTAYQEHSQYHGMPASADTCAGDSSGAGGVVCRVVEKTIRAHGLLAHGLSVHPMSALHVEAVNHALIRHSAAVKKMDLNSCHVGNGGLRILTPSLSHCSAITKLHLAHNNIDDGELLATALSGLRGSLRILSLNGNRIGDDGFQHLSAVLQDCRKLVVVSLRSMSLTGASLLAVGTVIQSCGKLVWLCLDGQEFCPAERNAEVQLVQAYEQHQRLAAISLPVEVSELLKFEIGQVASQAWRKSKRDGYKHIVRSSV